MERFSSSVAVRGIFPGWIHIYYKEGRAGVGRLSKCANARNALPAVALAKACGNAPNRKNDLLMNLQKF